MRWAAIEAVARYHGGAPFRDTFTSIAERRGKTKANVAIARRRVLKAGLRRSARRRSAVSPTKRSAGGPRHRRMRAR